MLCILAVCIKKRRPFYRVSFCLSFANALQRSALLDELPRRPRAAPVAAQSVRFRLLDQLVPVHRHAVLLCQVQYDFQIHVLFRPQEGNELSLIHILCHNHLIAQKVYLHILHAFGMPYSLFHMRLAGRAGHPRYGKFLFHFAQMCIRDRLLSNRKSG